MDFMEGRIESKDSRPISSLAQLAEIEGESRERMSSFGCGLRHAAVCLSVCPSSRNLRTAIIPYLYCTIIEKGQNTFFVIW